MYNLKNKGSLMMNTYFSNSETDTMTLAKSLASKLHIGDVIVLSRRFGVW